jgi:integrase
MPAKRRQFGGIDRLPSGRYRVRVTDPVSGERVSLGTHAAKADAEKAFAEALTEQSRGTWVSPDASKITLATYAPQWLESRLSKGGAGLRPRVRELYEGQLRLHILPRLGDLPLGQLRTATVRAWYTSMIKSGPGASTSAKCYRLLRAILNTAVEDGIVAMNPCTIRGAGAERSAERAIPTIREVFALAAAVQPRYRALVLLAAFGGLRRGELFGLARGHIDLDEATVSVEIQRQQLSSGKHIIGPPKSDAGRRIVSIPTEALEPLRTHLDRWTATGIASWVFTGPKGGPLRDGVWQQEWDSARRQVGLPDLHFHDLRHVAATLTAATGAGVKEIMYRLGHSSPQAALRYQHATADRDRAIAEAISRLIQVARS